LRQTKGKGNTGKEGLAAMGPSKEPGRKGHYGRVEGTNFKKGDYTTTDVFSGGKLPGGETHKVMLTGGVKNGVKFGRGGRCPQTGLGTTE